VSDPQQAPIEALFYHLERSGLDTVLAPLLEKCRARGWRALVRGAIAERLEMLDAQLWTYRDDSFLPHGLADDPRAARQPILLTSAPGNPNAAQALFLIDGAGLDGAQSMARVCVLFDGGDSAALAHARAQWKEAKALGLAVSYWQEGEGGRWSKKA
jgi:DNA polymerase-3 subunit chi